jgi:hypothetical protein
MGTPAMAAPPASNDVIVTMEKIANLLMFLFRIALSSPDELVPLH